MRCTGRGRGTGRGARGWRRSSVDLHRQHFICPHRRNGHRSFLCCSRGLFPCLFCGSAVALLQARSCLCLRSDGASGTSTSSGDNGVRPENLFTDRKFTVCVAFAVTVPSQKKIVFFLLIPPPFIGFMLFIIFPLSSRLPRRVVDLPSTPNKLMARIKKVAA
jgi:hypothetical protein